MGEDDIVTFEKICEIWYSRIFKYILGMTGSREDAKDLTQEVFFIAYQKGKEFERHEKPGAFLYATAKNLVLEYYRKRKKEILEEPNENIVDKEGDIFEQICRKHEDSVEDEHYKLKVLHELSTEQMELYEKYYVKHQSMKEIASAMGISETAVRMRYVRLRKEIKKAINKFKLGDF